MNNWFVYVLQSPSTDATYVGVSTDVARRLRAHNGAIVGGAKRTRAGRPWNLVKSYGPYESRSQAQIAECELKRLRGPERFAWKG